MFVHLHTHSHYSLLDGLGTIDQLIARAKENGASALALTDHGVMYGAIEFYQKCKKAGIKPIIGVEAYIAFGDMKDRNPREKPYHLTLLAKNNVGYKNLMKITSLAHIEGFYYKPRIDWATLKKHSTGLIATSGCLNGPLSRPLLAGQNKTTAENLKILIDIFGKDNIYLELQPRNMDKQKLVNEGLRQLAQEHNMPLIATNDIHYVNTDDADAHDVLICIQTKHKKNDTERMSYLGEDYSMINADRLRQLMPDADKLMANTVKLAARCNVKIELGVIQLPNYELPGNVSADEELLRLCVAGVSRRFDYDHATMPAETKERLDYELKIIKKTGYATYFLIVQDFVNWAKEQKIVVGPGRGSAAGSLVSYLIGITNLDPLKYDLIFERFLNPERVSMPDIDLDFADNRRDEVIEYVENKYGKDHVSQIITFGTMAARASVRDVGRVLGFSYSYCDQVAKMIPMFTSLKESLANVQELKQLYQEDTDAQRLLDMAKKVEGLARHSSTHACGVLITKEPLVNYTPIQYAGSDDKTIISQYSLHPVEDLGLLKMDFLGLKNLTVLQQSIKIIEATKGVKIDIDNIPLDDKATFDLLQKAQTTGVFQLESGGMKRYLKQLKPSELEDIIAMVSLYRPGPMDFIPDFIAGKHGRKAITYLHPKLEPILKNTYGIAIYQEQIMKIARDLAGFTYAEADVLRKAVGKKIKKLLDQQEEALVSSMIKNGIDKQTANKIWEFIVPFARYGFNRSHAACYAMIAYQTAYLKSNYPEAFMAALLSADQDNIDRVTIEINECRKMGIEVLAPDVNESFSRFAVVPGKIKSELGKIRFGLNAVKNVGHHIAKEIINERKDNGPFKSLEDFLNRIKDKDLNKKSLESLFRAGAFDSLISRGQALGNLHKILEFNKKIQNDHKSGQNNLFADLPLASVVMSLKLDEYPDAPAEQKLSWEKELLGLYISDHPFRKYTKLLPSSTVALNLLKNKINETITIAGVVTFIHKIITHKGQPMLFVTIEDSKSSVEVLVFPKILETSYSIWEEENKVLVTGKVSDKDGQPKILAEKAQIITDELINSLQAKKMSNKKLRIVIPHGSGQDKKNQLKTLLSNSSGMTPVYLEINNGHTRKIKTNIKVLPDSNLQAKIVDLLGQEAWQMED